MSTSVIYIKEWNLGVSQPFKWDRSTYISDVELQIHMRHFHLGKISGLIFHFSGSSYRGGDGREIRRLIDDVLNDTQSVSEGSVKLIHISRKEIFSSSTNERYRNTLILTFGEITKTLKLDYDNLTLQFMEDKIRLLFPDYIHNDIDDYKLCLPFQSREKVDGYNAENTLYCASSILKRDREIHLYIEPNMLEVITTNNETKKTIDVSNNDISKYKPNEKTESSNRDETVLTQANRNSLIKKVEDLKIMVTNQAEKVKNLQDSKLNNDKYIDINPANSKLFEFYNKIQSEADLEDICNGYRKYKDWMKLFDNDEVKLTQHLKEFRGIQGNCTQSSKVSLNNWKEIKSKESNQIRVKVFKMDLNICFKFVNDSLVPIPTGLYMLMRIDKKLSPFKIELTHGIGQKSSKIFTRFQHEFGNNFQIGDIKSVKIIDRSGQIIYKAKDHIGEKGEDSRTSKQIVFDIMTDIEYTDNDADIISTSIDCDSELEDNDKELEEKKATETSSSISTLIPAGIVPKNGYISDIDGYDLLTDSDV